MDKVNSQKRVSILTEEELQDIGNLINDLYHDRLISDLSHTRMENLILSHSSLLSANAELSFKNMKLQEEIAQRKKDYNKLLRECVNG